MDTSSPGRQSLTFSFTPNSPSLNPEWFWEPGATAAVAGLRATLAICAYLSSSEVLESSKLIAVRVLFLCTENPWLQTLPYLRLTFEAERQEMG